MKINDKVTLERVLKAVEEDDNLGFCIACGEDAYSVEPDAHHYQCDCCGANAVFGADELLLYLN